MRAPPERVFVIGARRIGLFVALGVLAGALACYAWFAVTLGEWRAAWFLSVEEETMARMAWWFVITVWSVAGLLVAVAFGKIIQQQRRGDDDENEDETEP